MRDQILPPELLTPEEMARADQWALQAGYTELMESAGWAVARAARHFGRCRTLVLCGPGNNGGDGWMAARLLAQQGWPVRVAMLAPPRPGSDAARVAAPWRGPMAEFSPGEAAKADLVIDAVFGAGLSRDIDPAVAATLAAARRVLAVDVPSGLDGATGQARGTVRSAAMTVTFFRFKPGHLLMPGRDLCGQLVLANIGMPARVLDAVPSTAFLNGPGLWHLPRLAAQDHKYSRGHVTVLGGPAMTGAARLSSAAARRGGAGMVTIAAGKAADLYRASADPGVIVTDHLLPDLLKDQRRKVWVCGPGLGAETAGAALPVLLEAGRQVVGDADLFTACAGQPDRLRGCAVITPHEGEFARVFGDIGADKLAAARAAARRIGGVVVLKGADTVIAAPDGRAAINNSAPPYLATAGSGDVLSGLVAALLASHLPAFDAAAAAAWVHGRAGAYAGAGLIAEDLPPAIARVMAER